MAQEAAMGYRKGKNEILELIEANYPLISVVSEDEAPVIETLVTIAKDKVTKPNYDVITWNIPNGFYCEHGSTAWKGFLTETKNNEQTSIEEKVEALFDNIIGLDKSAIFILQDFDYVLKDVKYAGLKLKDVIQTISQPTQKEKIQKRHAIERKSGKKHVVILSSSQHIPPELDKLTSLVYFGMPGKDEIGVIVDNVLAKDKIWLAEEFEDRKTIRESIIKASLGLTEPEVENALWKSIANGGRVNAEYITSLKEQIIKKGGILEFINLDKKHELGGMKRLKEYAKKRKIAFNDELREKRKLPYPKGMLLTGIQGCGKSESVKMMAQLLGFPLIRLDMGSLMDKYVGNSEKNLKKAINLVESVSPAILWIDEV